MLPTQKKRAQRTLPTLAVLGALAGCAAPVDAPRDVDATTEGLRAPYCDTAAQPRWSMYGQGLLAQRCIKSDNLPTAANANELQLQWDNPVYATTSTPALAYGHAYYGDHAANFYAVDAETGDIQWVVNLFTPGTVSNYDPLRSSAAVTESAVYVATGHKLFKLDRHTGDVIWDHLMDPHWAVLTDSSPVPVGDKVLIGVAGFELFVPVADRTFRGSVKAVDAATGELVWQTYTTGLDEGAGVSVWSSFAVDEERQMAFIGTGNTYEEPAAQKSDSLLAIDIATGDILWQHQYVAGDVFVVEPHLGPGPDADVGATPNLFTLDGQDVVGVGNKSGIYKVLDRDTGEIVSGLQLTTAVEVALADPNIPDDWGTAYVGGIMGSAAVAEGVIYVNSNIWWTYDFVRQGTQNPADRSVTYAVDARTGAVLWATAMAAPHFGGLTKVNDVIYHTLTNGYLVGLDAATGAYVLYEQLPAPAGGGVSAQDDRLYVGYGFSFSPDIPVYAAGVRAYALPVVEP